jgi:Universal stress protein family.
MTPRKRARSLVVVAWDGSPAAATAFPVARMIGAQLGADVEILHFLPKGTGAGAIADAARQHGLGDAEMPRLRVETGDPVKGILRTAEDAAVQVVILTTHGRAVEEGRRLGRVAEQVVARTTTPIILVRPEAPPVREELKRLLLPVDGTPKTAKALQPATDLAARLGASLDLLYVAARDGDRPTERGSMTTPRYVDQKHHEWPDWADEVVERLAVCCANCPPEVPVEMHLAHGDIGREIERFAIEHKSDAIVLVRRSRLQVGRAKILRAVITRAPCPILICGGPET